MVIAAPTLLPTYHQDFDAGVRCVHGRRCDCTSDPHLKDFLKVALKETKGFPHIGRRRSIRHSQSPRLSEHSTTKLGFLTAIDFAKLDSILTKA